MAKDEINNLYTVILTNYNNNLNEIEEALKSVLEQTYSNIELIIVDDCSEKFEQNEIKKYINENKKNNIKQIEFILNKKNLGTTKSLNKAIEKSSGDYILFFASDDKLATNDVLEKYSKIFMKHKVNIITSRWIMCDENLKPIKPLIPKLKGLMYNLFPNMFKKDMTYSNKLGSGSTTYRKEIFDTYKIDEKYRLLEDWPFWLTLIENNEKFYFASFEGLLHRANGISESQKTSNTKKIFYNEMLCVFRNQILPNFYKYRLIQKFKILRSYNVHIDNYSPFINLNSDYKYLTDIIRKDKVVRLLIIIDKLRPKLLTKIRILIKYNKVIVFTFLFTILTSIALIKLYNIKYVFLSVIVAYLFFYIILNWINNLVSLIRRKL